MVDEVNLESKSQMLDLLMSKVGMKKKGLRICDICGNLIPENAIFQQLFFPSRNKILYLHLKGIKETATWTQISKDKIRLDLCQNCQQKIEHRKELDPAEGSL